MNDVTRVRVHIERLVLDGVPGYDRPADGRRLQAAVSDALATQLRERPLGTPSWSHRERAQGEAVRVGAGVTPERLGGQVARAVHRGLSR